jgi:hypothetical protein
MMKGKEKLILGSVTEVEFCALTIKKKRMTNGARTVMQGKGKEMVPRPGEVLTGKGEGVNFELMKLAVNEDKWW